MNTVYTKIYNAPKLDISEVLRYSGAKEATAELERLIEECVALAWDKLSYKVCYMQVPIEYDGEHIVLGNIKTNSCDLKKNLFGCESAYIFASTVGISLDRLIARLGTVSPAKALILQALGAERIESLCNTFCDEIAAGAKKSGEFTRPRFSPGYGDFALEYQKDIFQALDCSRKIGLSLNESLMMSPTKSVTAIIGVGKVMCEEKSGCEKCPKSDCAFRRTE